MFRVLALLGVQRVTSLRDLQASAEMPASARHCLPVPVTPTRLKISQFFLLYSMAYFHAIWEYHEKYHAQKLLQNARKFAN
jgi:hypothetical protein